MNERKSWGTLAPDDERRWLRVETRAVVQMSWTTWHWQLAVGTGGVTFGLAVATLAYI